MGNKDRNITDKYVSNNDHTSFVGLEEGERDGPFEGSLLGLVEGDRLGCDIRETESKEYMSCVSKEMKCMCVV